MNINIIPVLQSAQFCHNAQFYLKKMPVIYDTDYVYMGCNNLTIDLIQNKTIFRLRG